MVLVNSFASGGALFSVVLRVAGMISVRYTLRSLARQFDCCCAACSTRAESRRARRRRHRRLARNRPLHRREAARARRGRCRDVSRARSDGARIREAARANGGRAWAGQCHLADAAAVAAFFERATAELGPVDILVNNAGIDARRARAVPRRRALGRSHERQSQRGVSLRARGGSRHAGAPVGPDHQRVVAQRAGAAAGQISYAASKAGLEGLTRALSRDLAAKGVLVNAVAPGLIETEMLEAMPKAAREELVERRGDGPDRPAARSGRRGGVSRV